MLIQKKEVKTKINLTVKTLYGKRPIHTFNDIKIKDKTQLLIDTLAAKDPEEIEKYHEIRLIYPMGYLQNLDP